MRENHRKGQTPKSQLNIFFFFLKKNEIKEIKQKRDTIYIGIKNANMTIWCTKLSMSNT